MSSRTPLRLNYELPANFIQRFRPVKAHAKEKGLQLYLFDLYGLRFYQRMATAGPLPDDAIWSVINPEGAESAPKPRLLGRGGRLRCRPTPSRP